MLYGSQTSTAIGGGGGDRGGLAPLPLANTVHDCSKHNDLVGMANYERGACHCPHSRGDQANQDPVEDIATEKSMTPLSKKLLQWLGLLLVGIVALDLAARILVSAIPLLATLSMFVLIFGLLFGFFKASK
jgi:hypothetical protein